MIIIGGEVFIEVIELVRYSVILEYFCFKFVLLGPLIFQSFKLIFIVRLIEQDQ